MLSWVPFDDKWEKLSHRLGISFTEFRVNNTPNIFSPQCDWQCTFVILRYSYFFYCMKQKLPCIMYFLKDIQYIRIHKFFFFVPNNEYHLILNNVHSIEMNSRKSSRLYLCNNFYRMYSISNRIDKRGHMNQGFLTYNAQKRLTATTYRYLIFVGIVSTWPSLYCL